MFFDRRDLPPRRGEHGGTLKERAAKDAKVSAPEHWKLKFRRRWSSYLLRCDSEIAVEQLVLSRSRDMALSERISKYKEIEKKRGRPIIAYVTSSRQNAEGKMAPDVVPEILDQLLLIPPTCKEVDVLIVSNGGDPTVAWRIMSLLREKVDHVGVLIPQAAFSAATLLALGANEIVMHPCGNLGPVDPQIMVPRTKPGQEKEVMHFGSEDLAGFLQFIRDEVGLSDQEHLRAAFQMFCSEAGAVPIGIATRASQLSISMGEKLLRMHMKGEGDAQKARTIAETLNKKFFHHGYPVGRKEAKELGLNVIEPDADLERLLWSLWQDLEKELICRVPFNPMHEVEKSPLAATLFAPIPQVTVPSGLTPEIAQQVVNAVLQQIQLAHLPPIEYELKHAFLESPRRAAVFAARGKIFARREADLKISINRVGLFAGWVELQVPAQKA